ncbi:hypothetical protein O3G_MSEX013204 [Manduca sexta]|uniref:Uncharacterized protein n=1 Tax=Manduca sexta TaxID=7130 RepID=A0A922CXP1_MANSE|nr:hypothetical protein O3G_MSEX013204 [Manduca sexta]
MLGAIVICVILLALEVEYSETRRHESNIAKTLYHLISSDESSSSSSSSSQDSEELRKGIDKYLKHISKIDEKFYKEKFRKEISEEGKI